MRSSSGNLSAETVTVTIPEGYTVRQTIALLAEKGVNTEEALTEAAQTGDFDYDFIDNESEDLSRLEGFLFPDTYEFYVGHNAEDALDRLIRNFVSRMDEDRMTQVEESSYSLQEIITIASLIEEETDGTDQANIASVIYNRLEGSGNKQGPTACCRSTPLCSMRCRTTPAPSPARTCRPTPPTTCTRTRPAPHAHLQPGLPPSTRR